MSHNIPFDIQAEIMKSLPVKPLIRFRLVSKQWNSLIGSSKFIAEYQKHKRYHHHLLVRLPTRSYGGDLFFSVVDHDTFPQQHKVVSLPMSVNLRCELHSVISSQGLVFLHLYDTYFRTMKAFIWNPTIGKSVDIDMCCALKSVYLAFFGVCPDTYDPRIIKFTVDQSSYKPDHPIYDSYDYRFRCRRESPIFEVFTLSTNVWRRLYKNLPREGIYITVKQVTIDRFMYWIAFEMINMDVGNQSWHKRNFIVSFDMKTEEFTEVNLPDSLDVDPGSIVNLYNSGESLVVVRYKLEVGKRVFSVWKLMKHGVSESFTKLYTISTTIGIRRVHGFRKSGEPIVEKKYSRKRDLFAYEFDSKHLNHIGIFGNPLFYRVSVTSYFETLLLLDH